MSIVDNGVGNHPGPPAPHLRAVLPGRFLPLAGRRRHRPGPRDRQAPRRGPRRPGSRRERAGPRHDRHLLVPRRLSRSPRIPPGSSGPAVPSPAPSSAAPRCAALHAPAAGSTRSPRRAPPSRAPSREYRPPGSSGRSRPSRRWSGHAADGRGDDGQPARHGLEHDQPQRLGHATRRRRHRSWHRDRADATAGPASRER